MKRRTENHQSENVNGIGIGIGIGSGDETQAAPTGMDFDIDDDEGWSFQRIGCGGYDNAGTNSDNNITTDMIFSSSSVGGSGGREINNPADFFLNQTSYVNNNGRQRLRRRNNNNKNKPKRPPKNSNKNGSKNNNNDDDDLSSLIASELTKMSLEDREKALEEVHGVVSDEDEDPEEMSKLLVQVKDELKRIRYKHAYEKAAFNSSSYVTDPEFVLMFLRADNYQARPAAMRLVEHFKYKLVLFGEDALVRDIMYSDLTDGDKSVLHSGLVQTTTLTDRAGRPIVICNMSEFLNNANINNLNRAMWYLSIRNTQMSASAGKNGSVGVFISHGMGNIFEKFSRESLTGTRFLGIALPYKYASVHFCFENNAFAMAMQTTLMLSLGKYARIRLRSHCGSRLECAYALKGFGIDIDNFGLANSLTLSESMQVMIQRCQLYDEILKTKQNARLLPQPNDVLLGRGRPFQLFPGNLALTDTINIYRTRYVASKKMDKKIITSEIVGNIRNSGGRFLKKANDDNLSDVDWSEVDFETARLKVSHSFRTMTKWHADRGHEWENGSQSRVSGELIAMSDESIQSIVADELTALGIVAESAPSSSDPQPSGVYSETYAQASFMNSETSNKRRRG